MTRVALPVLLRSLRGSRNAPDAISRIDRLRADLDAIDLVLEELRDRLASDGWIEPVSEPIDAGWWRARRRDIIVIRRHDRKDEAAALWISAWASALAADDYDLCRRIIRSNAARPSGDMSGRLARLTTAYEEEQRNELIAEVDAMLAEPALLSVQTATVLAVLRTRVPLTWEDDPAAARTVAAEVIDDHLVGNFERRDGFAGRPYWRALALAVRAEVDLASENLDAAERRLLEASAAVAVPFDVHVIMGMLHERRDQWQLADDAFDRALAGGADPTRTALLCPRPSRLLLRAARLRTESELEAALELIDEALRVGIGGAEEFPDTEAYVARAELLTQLDRVEESSSAYLEAAKRTGWAGSNIRSLELYRKACAVPSAPAEAWWWFGEELRAQAIDSNDVIDIEMMQQAGEAVANGLAQAAPTAEFGWVRTTQGLVTAALASMGRGSNTDPDPLVLLEGALLLNPDDATPYAFLAILLSRGGYLAEALQAAEQGYARAHTDRFVLDRLLGLLGDHSENERALELAHEYIRSTGDVGLLVGVAGIHLRSGGLEAAQDALAGVEAITGMVRLMRGTCYAMQGDVEHSRAEFTAAWHEARAGGDKSLGGWAAYRIGRLEEAIATYAPLVDKAPGYMNFARDLGQMRLARGDPSRHDVIAGEQLLRRGVAHAVSPADLEELRSHELAILRTQVSGAAHEQQVEDIIGDVEVQIGSRIASLLGTRRDPEELSARLARARSALGRGDPETAFRDYLRVTTEAEPPPVDVSAGLMGATQGLFALGDDLATNGRLDEATDTWLLLDSATLQVDEGDVLAAALAARRAVLAVASRRGSVRPDLDVALAHRFGRYVLTDAIFLFARDQGSLWNIYDGLSDLARNADGLPEDGRSTLADLARRIPLNSAYRLDQAQLPSKLVAPSVINALEMVHGTDHRDSVEKFKAEIKQLRQRLSAEMGVRIQGVRRIPSDSVPSDQIQIRIWGQAVVTQYVDPHAEDSVGQTIRLLEGVLRAELYRLIGPDDIPLWLEDWDTTNSMAHPWNPDDPAQARLRLVRVLRMLLREGVSVRDRGTILTHFAARDARGGFDGPVAALRAVRLGLGPRTLGLREGDRVRALDPGLAERFRDGLLDGNGSRWEMDRADAADLVRALRVWLADLDPFDTVVAVDDARLRLFVWRMCAAERPPIRVLSTEEVEHA